MNIGEIFQQLWSTTGICNFVKPVDPTIESAFEQFLHQFGCPIMLVICLFLMYLGIKKQYEPLLLIPIAFGGFL